MLVLLRIFVVCSTSLETTSPGYGNNIACVLVGKASEDTIRKMEKSLMKISLMSKRRKMGVARKDSSTT
jgi:hypothetical protein